MLTSGTNTAGFEAKLRALEEALPHAGEAANKVMGQEFVKHLSVMAPRDTNRYVRGWIEAGNKAGLTSSPLPPVVPSRSADRLAGRLERQLAEWEARLERARKVVLYWDALHQSRYVARGRSDKWEKNLLARKAEAEKRVEKLVVLVERAKAQVEAFEATGGSGIVIWGRKTKSQLAKGQLATVRERVYGGAGQFIRNGWNSLVRLHNLEGHATLVEKRYRVVARALAMVRATGARRARRDVVQALRARFDKAA